MFRELYATAGRPSIPPEKLLRSLLLQILYSIRSERMLVEQLDYNLLFRWFIGLSMDEAVWSHSSYSKNRDRILHTDIAVMFLRAICEQAEKAGLLSDEHFTVDGTLIESWASLKSFRPKDQEPPQSPKGGRNPEVDFLGGKRINDADASITDPEARLFRKGKGKEAKIAFMGHVLMENRNGLVVDSRLTPATGTAEREAALSMLAEGQIQGRKENRLAVHALRCRIQPDTPAKSGVACSSLRRNPPNLDEVSSKMKKSASKYGKTAHRGSAKFQRTN